MMTGCGEIINIRLSLIEPDPLQPRKSFPEDSLKELSESVAAFGVIEPLIVRKNSGYGYLIIAGERRWRAARMAGLTEVPCIVRDYSERDAAAVSIIENVQREDLNCVEEALAYKRYIDCFGVTQEDLSKAVGKNRATIANLLRMLKLPDEVLSLVSRGVLSAGHAKAVLAVPSGQQLPFAKMVAEEGLSVREAEKKAKTFSVKQGKKKSVEDGPEDMAPYLEDIASKCTEAAGVKVSVRGDGMSGSVVVDYYSMDDLERIYSAIMSLGAN